MNVVDEREDSQEEENDFVGDAFECLVEQNEIDAERDDDFEEETQNGQTVLKIEAENYGENDRGVRSTRRTIRTVQENDGKVNAQKEKIGARRGQHVFVGDVVETRVDKHEYVSQIGKNAKRSENQT